MSVFGLTYIKENGGLEIHVPRPFTAERPAVSYASQVLDEDIEDHPLAKNLPKATQFASIQPGPAAFRAFAAQKNTPETLEDFIYSDAPQLSLYITTFKNATLVSLSWPHTLMDVMGQQALLHSWSLVLAGRESEVPPLLGAREDVIRAASDAPVEKIEEYSLVPKRLKGWAMAVFTLRLFRDMLRDRDIETRTIFLPKRVMADLQLQAQIDLAAHYSGGEKPFVSEGDVLAAWTLRAAASTLPQPRPMAVFHAINARFRLSSLLKSQGVYIQNMAMPGFSFVSPEVAAGPLGISALENRRCLMEQSTESQVLAWLRELRKEETADGNPLAILYCESNDMLFPFTNWTRAHIFKAADFSHAVVRTGESKKTRANPPGTMTFHHAQSMRESPTVKNIIVVLGKDHADNYWLTGTLLPSAWAKIQDDIDKMSEYV